MLSASLFFFTFQDNGVKMDAGGRMRSSRVASVYLFCLFCLFAYVFLKVLSPDVAGDMSQAYDTRFCSLCGGFSHAAHSIAHDAGAEASDLQCVEMAYLCLC